MSRKPKHGKGGNNVFLSRNRGGKTRTANMSIDHRGDQLCTALGKLSTHITSECYQLAVEFEEVFHQLDLRTVGLDSFFVELQDQVKERSVSETRMMKCVDGTVIGPLRDLCQKMAQLHTETMQSEQSQLRSLQRSSVSADSSNFDKMLCAFEHKVEGIIKLNEQDANGRQVIAEILTTTNRCAARGEHIKRLIMGEKTNESKLQTGLEQALDDLIRQTARELADDKSALHSREEMESRWETFENLLESYRQAKENFELARKDYDINARKFFNEHDSLGLYKGEWHRQRDTIRYAEEFFNAAGIDPFELSDTLANIDRKSVLTMPDQDEREALEAGTPTPFPQLRESRVEERAQNTIKEIVEAIDALDSPPPEVCPVSLAELALCTYAAFVARYANGKPYPTSGRTTRKVYEAMLVPAELTYGCTEEQFKDAIKEAGSTGWLQFFKRKTRNAKIWHVCYQPTVEGFAHAETLYAKLPSDFRDRIFAQHELLREEAASYRKKRFSQQNRSQP